MKAIAPGHLKRALTPTRRSSSSTVIMLKKKKTKLLREKMITASRALLALNILIIEILMAFSIRYD